MSRYLAPRGLPAVLAGLAEAAELTYAVTGSLAAERCATYAPSRLGTIHVDDVAAAAEVLGLQEVDTGANLLLAAPVSQVVFDRASKIDGVSDAAPSQVAVALLTGPGRKPAEGRVLIEWMENDERAWRQ